MISIESLTVEFSAKPLFTNASFVVNDRDRIALVGKNGAGKSTLLKILCGMQQPTSGVVSIPNDTTIGYLPQVMRLQDNTTVREETRKAFAGHTEMAGRLERMNRELSERTDYDSADYMALVERYTEAHERYLMMGAEGYEAEMERTLHVLDCAVLVISGSDGVQAHTETLWRLLRRYGVPVFLFVTKMDMPGADRAALLAGLRGGLSERILDVALHRSPERARAHRVVQSL